MLVEMLVAEMRDREALTEYDQIFAEEIEPMLTALPGVRRAYFAYGESPLLGVVIVVWVSREIATQWRNQHGHRALSDTLRPYIRGEVNAEFFRLEPERGYPERHILN